MKLTSNFTLKEMVASTTASRRGIKNIPTQKEIDNLKQLCITVLQPARDHFSEIYPDSYIRVNSGFRCKKLNDLVGSTDASFHRHGYAADIELMVKDANGRWQSMNDELYFYLKEYSQFTELIWEYGDDDEPEWVHVAYNPNDSRKMVKRIPKSLPIK